MAYDCSRAMVTDPMYEEIIDDLIKAGDILISCKHEADLAAGPCSLCTETWRGCVDNAEKIKSGRRLKHV